MKVHKVESYIVDFDDVGEENIKDMIEDARYPNRCISLKVIKIATKDIGEWNDDHPLNRRSTAEAELKRLFGN